jgi:xylan 1,4-beta-xylosidase
VLQFPSNNAVTAPNLSSSGIPWMVPKSDMFNDSTLHPNWSFLGYTRDDTYSLTERKGWLYLKPYSGENTVIQNDGEHNYSLITRMDFEPESSLDEAGLWIINGPETLQAKVFGSVNDQGKKVFVFSFNTTSYEVENTIDSTVWLKLIRDEHKVSGFYSSNGYTWIQIGEPINASTIDISQTQFNDFTGNQQGLYVKGKPAYFDLYIYRDAYTNISAQSPANKFGVSTTSSYMLSINNNDWAMYAGVEFGGNDYQKTPISMELSASSDASGGIVEVWLDSIDTGRKIAECQIDTTGSWTNYQIFRADVDSVSGSHDVYLKFLGTGSEQLFRINWFRFLSEYDTPTSVDNPSGEHGVIQKFQLRQNFPNPFNPITNIRYSIANTSKVTLKVFDVLGTEVQTLVNEVKSPGQYTVALNAQGLASGIYFYQLNAGSFAATKKLMLLK